MRERRLKLCKLLLVVQFDSVDCLYSVPYCKFSGNFTNGMDVVVRVVWLRHATFAPPDARSFKMLKLKPLCLNLHPSIRPSFPSGSAALPPLSLPAISPTVAAGRASPGSPSGSPAA